MSAPHATTIIEGYLARLSLSLAEADPLRRRELVEDVGAHIAEARASLVEETDDEVFGICERLGEPAELAREIGAAAPGGPAQLTYGWTWLEVAGIVLTVMAWPVGAILVLLSRVWTFREKLVATAIGAVTFAMGFPLSAPVLGALVGSVVPSLDGPALLVLGTLGMLPVVAAAYLAYRLPRISTLRAQTA